MDCLLLSFDYYDNHIMLENFLIFFYNFEAIIKILGEGFYFDRNAYFKDKWNIFDFILNILMSIYKIIINNTGEKIRVLQIMRFFKILKIAPIKLICLKLASTFSLLAETFLLILIFCLFYALWALHLFAGLLKQSCFYKETGLLDELKANIFCGNLGFECPFNMICGKMLANPDYGASNYDNIMFSLLQVFKIMTLDDWTASMFSLQQTFSKYVWLYFVSLVILGNFFIMNLILAVLKVKYSQADLNYTLKTKETENMIYDLKELKDKNIIRKRGNRLETIAIKSKNKKSILDKLKMVDITGKNEEIEKKYRLIPVKYSSKRVMRFNQKFKVLLLLINRWFWTLYNRMKSQAIKNLNFIKRSQLQIRVKTELKYDSMNINDVLPKRFL